MAWEGFWDFGILAHQFGSFFDVEVFGLWGMAAILDVPKLGSRVGNLEIAINFWWSDLFQERQEIMFLGPSYATLIHC